MKQRIIVAVIGIPLLLAILCVAPDWATAALLAALSVVPMSCWRLCAGRKRPGAGRRCRR